MVLDVRPVRMKFSRQLLLGYMDVSWYSGG